jgi:hypothetical protein
MTRSSFSNNVVSQRIKTDVEKDHSSKEQVGITSTNNQGKPEELFSRPPPRVLDKNTIYFIFNKWFVRL